MRVLAFGAHPDDIEIGMGGTIARHANAGDHVVMVVVAIPNNKDVRREDAERAAGVLGADLNILDIPLDELAHSRTVVKRSDKLLKRVNQTMSLFMLGTSFAVLIRGHVDADGRCENEDVNHECGFRRARELQRLRKLFLILGKNTSGS